MKDVLGRGIAVAAIGLMAFLGGCDCNGSQTDRSVGEEEEAPAPPPKPEERKPPEPEYGTRIERANELLDDMVEAAMREFSSADETSDATFPGGTGVEWSTIDAPPKEGATYALAVGDRRR